jgi:hypothetical protein
MKPIQYIYLGSTIVVSLIFFGIYSKWMINMEAKKAADAKK